jgi:predicted DNA-binding transcriptional regulator YafY
MFDLQSKFKRQIEILGLAAGNGSGLRALDVAAMYECEELTIKRDLSELRGAGIDIHSVKGRGLRIEGGVEDATLQALLTQYLQLCTADRGVDKAVALMVRRRGIDALQTVVHLQRCIDSHTCARIDYLKEEGQLETGRVIAPLLLFQSERYWRVLAINEGVIKQFHLNKIEAVHPTEERFDPVPEDRITDMFRYSFRSWIGEEQYRMRIRLSPVWARRLKPRQLMESQIITEEADGTVIFEATVNSLDEIASWVVSRGEGVTVLEPPELRDRVIAIATGALDNYRSED